MLYLLGINISLFLALILASKKSKSDADKILALWLVFTGIHLLLIYIHKSNSYNNFPYLLGIELPLPLVHAPFLYIYTVALTDKNTRNKFRILHFIPFIASYALLYDFLGTSLKNKIYVYEHNGEGYEKITTFFLYLIVLQGLVYITLSYIKLKKHQQIILNEFSYTNKVQLNWLRYLICGTGIIWLAIISANDEIIYFTVVVFILLIGYFGIKQVGIFTQDQKLFEQPISEMNTINENELILENHIQPELLTQKNINSKIETKYQKSTLTDVMAKQTHIELTKLLNDEKLYKTPELTLSELAKRLNISSHHLSQVINTFEKKNFFDYINHKRVEEFKKCVHLPENQKFTFLSLAFECGFNSKTSFNRNFKKVTNFSPSDYLKQENIHLQE